MSGEVLGNVKSIIKMSAFGLGSYFEIKSMFDFSPVVHFFPVHTEKPLQRLCSESLRKATSLPGFGLLA